MAAHWEINMYYVTRGSIQHVHTRASRVIMRVQKCLLMGDVVKETMEFICIMIYHVLSEYGNDLHTPVLRTFCEVTRAQPASHGS